MSKQGIRAALFDLDGVIAFTDKYHYLAWKKLADEEGWDFDETINNRLRGIPRLASLEVILEHNHVKASIESKSEWLERKNRYYIDLLRQINEDDIYPGVIGFLKELREQDVAISLCSSSKNAELVLSSLKMIDLFDAIVTGNDIKNAKPDPEIFLLGASRLGVSKENCVVFEDAKAGIEGAMAANMKTIGVGNLEETEGIADRFIMHYEEVNIEEFLNWN